MIWIRRLFAKIPRNLIHDLVISIMTVFNNGVIDTIIASSLLRCQRPSRDFYCKTKFKKYHYHVFERFRIMAQTNSVIKFTEQVNELKFLQESEK